MSASGSSRVEGGAKPRVFVCPGIYGDDRRLAAFRSFCAADFDMELLDLPAPEAPAAILGDIPRTGLVVAERVCGLQPAGPVRLAGYSFGGNVALEAARRLVHAGRTVSLVMIDAYLADPAVFRPRQRRSLTRRLFWLALGRLSVSDVARRGALTLVGRGWPDKRAGLSRRMLWSLRSRATAAWRPEPVSAPAMLVMSEPFAPGLALWQQVLPQAAVVRLPYDHWDILKPPAALRLRDLLVAHLGRAA